jgi:hypothetical protein
VVELPATCKYHTLIFRESSTHAIGLRSKDLDCIQERSGCLIILIKSFLYLDRPILTGQSDIFSDCMQSKLHAIRIQDQMIHITSSTNVIVLYKFFD